MTTKKVELTSKNWQLIHYLDEETGASSLVLTTDEKSPIELILDLDPETLYKPFKKYNNIHAEITTTHYDDPGYFREFLEDGQEASDFITQVYQWCVRNGFWDL